MIPRYLALLFYAFLLSNVSFAIPPPNFMYLKYIDPTIIQDIRYYSDNNFVGQRIRGYDKPECIVTRQAGLALHKLQRELNRKALGIKVYDCYRPQQAVNQFLAWSQDPYAQKMKSEYYPHVDKREVFSLGYVSTVSAHMRGSTIDMTIVSFKHGKKHPRELDMGTHFDYLDPASHPLSTEVSQQARHNRLWLRSVMLAAGFKPIGTEWWHFTLANEPYPDRNFNFEID